MKVNPTTGHGGIIEANKKDINGNTKLKINLSLLKQKLLEEKALQQMNVLEATKNPGFAVNEHTSDGLNANKPIANQQVRNSGNNPRSLHTIFQPNVHYTFFIVVWKNCDIRRLKQMWQRQRLKD